MSSNKCKVEVPNQLPESNLTRVQFKTWKESMVVYLKQNDNFNHFSLGVFMKAGNRLKKMKTESMHSMPMISQKQTMQRTE